MENSSNISRFIIAALLSMVVLFAWSYFFAPPPPADNANTNANVAANNATSNSNTPTANTTAAQTQPTPTPEPTETPAPATEDNAPQRQLVIKTPLYEATFDSKGAVATSWILKESLSSKGTYPLWADGSDENNKIPLQLISQKALESNPRAIHFRLSTPDENLNNTLNLSGYAVSDPDETIELAAGEEKTVEFTFTGAGGVEVKKVFTFRGDSYISDLAVSVTQNGQPVQNTKLLIGASIGDHAINHHTFYQIESEGVSGI